jgi:ATP-binding cassette subfamily B protein
MAKIAVPIFRKMQKTIDKANRILREQLTGIKVIRAFVRDLFEQKRFDKTNNMLRKLNTTTGRMFSSLFPIVMFIVNLTNVAIFYLSANQIDEGKMEIGSITAITTYVLQILISVTIAAMMIFMLPRAQVSAKRINKVLKTDSTISYDNKGNMQQKIKKGTIELKNVEFMYHGATKPVVQNISFSVKPGEKVAIIGSTGSGKSTIINLITRLYDATNGSIKIGGINIKNADLESLWAQIGIAPQKAYLFSGTIKSNMLFGSTNATDDDIWKALEIAQAKEFVENLPEKLDAPVAQGGSNFSGGQKQRLSIARAIIKNPNIYLFDDSFSALDFSVDANLRKALEPVTKNACVITIAQRVGTIMNSDKIIVMDNGQISGMGTHAELLKTNSIYKEIVYSQFSVKEAKQGGYNG